MAKPETPAITVRKLPKQARANDLVAAVLDAAVQVLRVEGANRFTTARVAQRAGVSVGSIRRYPPNKAAVPFRRQAAEAAPAAPVAERGRAAALIGTTLSRVDGSFPEVHRASAEIATQADALAGMVCADLDRPAGSRSPAAHHGRPATGTVMLGGVGHGPRSDQRGGGRPGRPADGRRPGDPGDG